MQYAKFSASSFLEIVHILYILVLLQLDLVAFRLPWTENRHFMLHIPDLPINCAAGSQTFALDAVGEFPKNKLP